MKTLHKEINIINEGILEFPIVKNGVGWQSTENDFYSMFESGPEKYLLSKIVEEIEQADTMICLQSFLIQDSEIIDALLEAVNERNIKVYVLSSAEARLKDTIEEEQDFIKTNYIQLLETKFKNNFVHRVAENFHGKYILIDPTTYPSGFICTNNFTENGFTKNPEISVPLTIEQCQELFKVFVYHFWEHATDEQTATKDFEKVKPANKFVLPKLEHILLTSPNTKNNSLNRNLLRAVENAKDSITFSTFQLDKNTELVKAISQKAKEKIAVTLFCRPIEKQFNEHLKELLEAGVKICFHHLIHAKSLLIDNENGFIFTANLTEKGLEKGFEVGVKLDDRQVYALADIHKNWMKCFPFVAIKSANVKTLESVKVFQNKNLVSKVLLNQTKEEKQKIIKVGDLFTFFNKQFEIKNAFAKSLNVKLTAEIEDLPTQYKTHTSDKFEVIEIEEHKVKSKIVVLKNTFKIDDINQLNELKDLKLYFA